jgi:uncharacterized membrane protein
LRCIADDRIPVHLLVWRKVKMAMNNPNKFVNSVSEELKGEFDDEARKNKAAQKITDRRDSTVFLGLTIGVVLGGILTGVIGFLLKWQVFTIFFAVIGGVVVGGLLGAMIVKLVNRGHNKGDNQINPKS